MVFKLNIITAPILIILIGLVFSCNDPKDKYQKPASQVVSKNISQPTSPTQPKKNTSAKRQKKQDVLNAKKLKKNENSVESEQKVAAVMQRSEHYSSKGKIDPFRPLFQEKAATPLPSKKVPARILTPLEKIELNQIRLVAVIVMKDRRIAMVEEAGGKGYEVSVGTYIGKQSGKITQIKDSSIVIREPVRDFKGRLSERVQEIKLQKNDIGE
ncbi:MAG: pilus assembly protein PilP [Desulfobacula sp.]|nr:pilus assembly protein PilP [Desulfobacula sp.]